MCRCWHERHESKRWLNFFNSLSLRTYKLLASSPTNSLLAAHEVLFRFGSVLERRLQWRLRLVAVAERPVQRARQRPGSKTYIQLCRVLGIFQVVLGVFERLAQLGAPRGKRYTVRRVLPVVFCQRSSLLFPGTTYTSLFVLSEFLMS